MSNPTIGEPIPKGFIDRTGIHMARPPIDHQQDLSAVVAMMDQVKSDLVALRGELARLGRKVGGAAQDHPVAAAFVVSVGLWTILGWGFRRMFQER